MAWRLIILLIDSGKPIAFIYFASIFLSPLLVTFSNLKLAILLTIKISSASPESRIEGGFITLVSYIFRRRSLGQPSLGHGIELISLLAISRIVILWRLLKDSGRLYMQGFFEKYISCKLESWQIFSVIVISWFEDNIRTYRFSIFAILSDIKFSRFPSIWSFFKEMQS